MGVISKDDCITGYFLAWLSYDLELLRFVFAPDAKYIIENKDRVYEGHAEIEKYWIRNKNRQRDLSLSWTIEERTDEYVSVKFNAQFYDIEEAERNTIDGNGFFCFDKNNRITVFREEYIKIITTQ